MADEEKTPDDTQEDDYDPEACHACRGTGKVISNKGEEPHEVACPWCEGSGRFIPEHDSQALAKGGTAAQVED